MKAVAGSVSPVQDLADSHLTWEREFAPQQEQLGPELQGADGKRFQGKQQGAELSLKVSRNRAMSSGFEFAKCWVFPVLLSIPCGPAAVSGKETNGTCWLWEMVTEAARSQHVHEGQVWQYLQENIKSSLMK